MGNWVASIKKYTLQFKFPAGTSRGILHEKPSWFLYLINKENGNSGIGEISVVPDLSSDYTSDFEEKLNDVVNQINKHSLPDREFMQAFPSINFGIETALLDAANGGGHILFSSGFTEGRHGIPINGLIWMGPADEMIKQVKKKIEEGFNCLKLKIGALNFDMELELLKKIRGEFLTEKIEIRLDANGSFSAEEATEKLKRLSEFNIHSLEQPIQPGQWNKMAEICSYSPIDIALDEELIGISNSELACKMLREINPKFIILKPSLLGGFEKSTKWIEIAEENNICWWITSALESNIGLNAIAQWVFTLNNSMVHGLGTGQIYINNFYSPLQLKGAELWHNPMVGWDFNFKIL